MSSFPQIVAATSESFRAMILKYMPACAYRDFCLWALSEENSEQREFLSLLGITQLANLTSDSLRGLLEQEEWLRIIERAALLNAYFVFEIKSDDLECGIMDITAAEDERKLRSRVIHAFNRLVVRRLRGTNLPIEQAMDLASTRAESISAFGRGRLKEKHRAVARRYLENHAHVTIEDLEYSVLPCLMTNIGAAADVADSLNRSEAATLLRRGLIRRYEAVDLLIESDADMPLSERVDVGADAILIVPTLAYYSSLLAETARPLSGLKGAIESGLLPDLLKNAARLIRLLNDLGPELLTQRDTRATLMDRLPSRDEPGQPASAILLLLRDCSAQMGSALTRIQKDIFCGEFNICVHGLAKMASLSEALTAFHRRVAYFSEAYEHYGMIFSGQLSALSSQLGDDVLSVVVKRFVDFHVKLYSQPYDVPAGDFALQDN